MQTDHLFTVCSANFVNSTICTKNMPRASEKTKLTKLLIDASCIELLLLEDSGTIIAEIFRRTKIFIPHILYNR